jgi:glycosyltransferase involved in cell wall biosynthesis
VARSIFFYTDSETFGGAEEALLMLIESLDRSAWHSTLVVPESPLQPVLSRRAEALNVPVRVIDPVPLGLNGAARLPELVRMLRRERPDVFHALLPWPLAAKYPLAAAVLARVPAVLGTVQLMAPFGISRSSRIQLRLLARGVDRYLAVSRDIKQRVIQRLGFPEAKIEVVYNAVRVERFHPAGAPQQRAELTGGEDRPVILTAARLDPQKGHPLLLRAAANLPGVLFAFAGDGPERETLEAQAAELGVGDRVRFLGQRDDVPELLRACDVFALPSLYEGSSLATLEAMAAGRAVICSAIPGTDELIVDGDSGLLVTPGDADALAEAINRVIADPELRAALGRRARERVERNFTAAAMARNVAAIYEQLLD